MSLFFVFFFPLFVSLGFWQLNRATEKDQLLAGLETQQVQTYTGQKIEAYNRFDVTGRWHKTPVFYMDNRTYQGKAGYEVWVPFESEYGIFVVAVGWLPLGKSRDALPAFNLPEFPVVASIVVRPDSMNPLYDESTNQANENDPQRWLVQSLSAQWAQQKVESPVLSLAQLAHPLEWGIGPSVWQPSVMSPEKHRAYAIQWFGMALALAVMFLYAAFIHKNNNE